MSRSSTTGSLLSGYVLGSGSTANGYLFRTKEATFLVDNGFSYKELKRRLALADCPPEDIDYLLLTHSHGDHCKGVPLLLKNHSMTYCSTDETRLALAGSPGAEPGRWIEVVPGGSYEWGGAKVRTFPLFHDTPGAVGYSIDFDGYRCVIITDTGVVSEAMADEAADADILFLESNYCPDLLYSGPYPYHVKQRIAGESGHLSNADAAGFLNLLIDRGKPGKVYLCHLSAKNNHPGLVADTLAGMLRDSLNYTVCPRDGFIRVL